MGRAAASPSPTSLLHVGHGHQQRPALPPAASAPHQHRSLSCAYYHLFYYIYFFYFISRLGRPGQRRPPRLGQPHLPTSRRAASTRQRSRNQVRYMPRPPKSWYTLRGPGPRDLPPSFLPAPCVSGPAGSEASSLLSSSPGKQQQPPPGSRASSKPPPLVDPACGMSPRTSAASLAMFNSNNSDASLSYFSSVSGVAPPTPLMAKDANVFTVHVGNTYSQVRPPSARPTRRRRQAVSLRLEAMMM